MKATLQDGTILEGTLEEIKTVIQELAPQTRQSYSTEKVRINNETFDAILPKRGRSKGSKGRPKRADAYIAKVCDKYVVDVNKYRKSLMDCTLGFEDIARQFKIPKSVVHQSRFLLRKAGVITFAYASTKARMKIYAGLKTRMVEARQLLKQGKARDMAQAMRMLAKK